MNVCNMSDHQETAKTEPSEDAKNNNNNNNSDKGDNNNVPEEQKTNVSAAASSDNVSAVSKSAPPKPSGLKPPSRIGRMCGGAQKPAVPPTPPKNSSDDSVRRVTDDFGRHRLTDVLEADESEEDGLRYSLRPSSRRKRYSSTGSAASSMDGLWETHPRRLSEAGLSRHSDSSAILTEDTDSFMIGQRVWVGGSKPGTIAFIGETQFAPGEWAGIALDEPIGKNDGSVGGIHYFQCENKKGVFSRLTRLTRVPLEQPGMGSNETFIQSTSHSTLSNNNSKRSPVSPTGSTRSLLKSAASLSNSNVSLSSASTHIDYKIGDRVIIKSTQGSKVGTVKYIGHTEFAPGEWVGVELDDPRGKNDGSVDGKRYFECRPHFGLFAPVSKVSKSPSKHKPGSSCVIHSGPGLPPSGIKRTNSKESLNSLASKASVASSNIRRKVPPKTTPTVPTRTALQDVLREKQQHIEQLLKERDLERAEITRAASQADEAEHKLLHLQQEYEQYRSECEEKLREHIDLLNQLKNNRTEIVSQLEDEKRKNEDLQFRFEESNITKSDLEAVNERNLTKIKELESLLSTVTNKSENTELLSNKLFESEEKLIKYQELLENLRTELEETKVKGALLENEKVGAAELVQSLRTELDDVKKASDAKTDGISQLEERLHKVTQDHDVVKRQAEEFKTLSDKTKMDCETISADMESLRRQFDELKGQLHEKSEAFDQTETAKANLHKENERLKMELSAKSLDLEQEVERGVARDVEIASLKEEIKLLKANVETKQAEVDKLKAETAATDSELRADLERTRRQLSDKLAENETTKKTYEDDIAEKKLQLDKALTTISRNDQEIDKLTKELMTIKTDFEQNHNDSHDRHKRQISDKDAELMSLAAELQAKNQELTNSAVIINKLEEEMCGANSEIEKLQLELQNTIAQGVRQMDDNQRLVQELSQSQLLVGDFQRKFQLSEESVAQLTVQKQALELQASTQCDISQVDLLRKEIAQRDTAIDSIRVELNNKLQVSERQRQELEIQANQHRQQHESALTVIQEKLQVALQSESLLKQRCDGALQETTKIKEELMHKITGLENSLKDKEMIISRLNSECADNDSYHKEQLERLSVDLSRKLKSYEDQVAASASELSQLRNELSETAKALTEAQSQYDLLKTDSEQARLELTKASDDNLLKLQMQLTDKSQQLQEALDRMAALKSECDRFSTTNQDRDSRINELLIQVQGGQQVIAELRQELLKALGVEDAAHKNEDLVSELILKIKNAEQAVHDLENERHNFVNLLNCLKITEQQKNQLIQTLSGNKAVKCEGLIALLNQAQVIARSESDQRLLVLDKDLSSCKVELTNRGQLIDAQKNQIERLERELVKAQMAYSTNGHPSTESDLVSHIQTTPNTQHSTLHAFPYTWSGQPRDTSCANVINQNNALRYHLSVLTGRLSTALNTRNLDKLRQIRVDLIKLGSGGGGTTAETSPNERVQYLQAIIKNRDVVIFNLQQKLDNLWAQCNQPKQVQVTETKVAPPSLSESQSTWLSNNPAESTVSSPWSQLQQAQTTVKDPDLTIDLLKQNLHNLAAQCKPYLGTTPFGEHSQIVDWAKQTHQIVTSTIGTSSDNGDEQNLQVILDNCQNLVKERDHVILTLKQNWLDLRAQCKQNSAVSIGGTVNVGLQSSTTADLVHNNSNATAPQVIFKQVPVYVPQPPKIIMQPVPLKECKNQVVKLVPVAVPSKPQIIVRQVPVYISPGQHLSSANINQFVNNGYLGPSHISAETGTVSQVIQTNQQQCKPVQIIKPIYIRVPVNVPYPVGHAPTIKPSQVVVPSESQANIHINKFGQITTSQSTTKMQSSQNLEPQQCKPVRIIKPIYIRGPVNVPYPVGPAPTIKPVQVVVPSESQANIAINKFGQVITNQSTTKMQISQQLESQPAKVIIKQVPVYIPTKPKIIIKEVPVFNTRPGQTITKQVPVPVYVPKIVVKQVPVYVPSKCKYNVTDVNLSRPVSSKDTAQFVNFNAFGPHFTSKESLVKACASVGINPASIMPPRIIIKKVPVPAGALNLNITRKKCTSRHSLPKTIIKPVPVYMNHQNTTILKLCQPLIDRFCSNVGVPPVQASSQYVVGSGHVSSSEFGSNAKIVVKQVPIYIQTPPKIFVKKVPVAVSGQNCSLPKVLVEKVFIPRPPRILVNQVPVVVAPQKTDEPTLVQQLYSCQNLLALQKQQTEQQTAQLVEAVPAVSDGSGTGGALMQFFGLHKATAHTYGYHRQTAPLKSPTSVVPDLPDLSWTSYQHASSSLSSLDNTTNALQYLITANRHTQAALANCMGAVATLKIDVRRLRARTFQQLLQDKELAENQIKFLNSIIVDMQRKNEEQKARIEILESGGNPAGDSETQVPRLPRQIPPRMYCDICEEFDLHETEDCPQQNTDAAPPLQRLKRDLTERPYCEICEAFGHATEDCQEDGTF